MVTVETLKSINVELDKDVELKKDMATNFKLARLENVQEVNLPGQIEVNYPRQIEVNVPAQIEVNYPRQIEVNNSGPSSSNVLPINDRQDSNSHSNQSNVKDEQSEQMKLIQSIYKLFAFYGFFLGYKLSFKSKLYHNVKFYCTNFFLCLTGFSIAYTVYVHCINGNMVNVLEPLAVSGLFLSCLLKWYGGIKHRDKIIALIISINKFCRPSVYGRQAEIIKSSLRQTKTYMLICILLGLVCGGFYALTPVYVYITTKEIIPWIPLEIVFCDQTQTKGFIIASIIHVIMGVYAALSLVYYASALIFAMANYTFQVTLIGDDFLALDEMWNGKNDIKLKHKRSFLKNICKKRQDMNNYIDELKSIFEGKLFWYFCASYLAQIICMYDIAQYDWIGGYASVFGIFAEMLFYCYMGTEVSKVDDKLCYIIYHCNWYQYDLVSQRMICVLLSEAQQSKELQLGPIGPLNLVTGVTIYKSVYSYYTIMTELF